MICNSRCHRIVLFNGVHGDDRPLKVMGVRYSTRFVSYLLLISLVLLFVFYNHIDQQTAWRLPSQEYIYDYTEEEPLDVDQTCRFPNPNPYDDSLLSFVTDPVPIRCRARFGELLTYIDLNGRLRFNKTALESSGYQIKSLSCTYQEIIRRDSDDDNVYFSDAVQVYDGIRLPCEFITVECRNFAGITVYNNIHAHVIKNETIAERTPDTDRTFYSFLFFVVDSMSRLNFIRQLPKTYFQLTRKMEAVVLRGITKVGDNTHPNIVPILTGKSDRRMYVDLNDDDVDGVYYLESPTGYYDDWPFTWKNLSRSGYVTLLAEDQPQFAVFNYYENGFRSPPTNHYMRPFWLALESSVVHRLSSNLCFSSTPKHNIQLQYVEEFLRKYQRVPYFGMSILTEISHDFVNQVGSADVDFAEFLDRLERDDLLANTVLVFMGDHGPRFDPIVETPLGRIESRMPFNAIVLPKGLRDRFPKAFVNLKQNAGRLTTVYDLHATVVDVLDYGNEYLDVLGELNRSRLVRSAWGKSLLTPISCRRTCSDAGIPHQYCVCERENPISIDAPIVLAAARHILSILNDETKLFRTFCTVVMLKSIMSAVALTPHTDASNMSSTADEGVKLRITVRVTPGDGVFEGLVVVTSDNDLDCLTSQLLNDINRINRYSEQTRCLPDYVLRNNSRLNLYCHCPVIT